MKCTLRSCDSLRWGHSPCARFHHCLARRAAIAFSPRSAPRRRRSLVGRRRARRDGDSQPGDEHHRYDDHRVRLEAGQRYRLSVNSDAFDPVAHLYRAGEAEPVAENDDGDGASIRGSTIRPPRAASSCCASPPSRPRAAAPMPPVDVLPPLPPGVPCPGRQRPDRGRRAGEGRRALRRPCRPLEAGRRYRLSVDPTPSIRSPSFARRARRAGRRNDDSGGRSTRASPTRRPRAAIMCSRVTPLRADGRGAYRPRSSCAAACRADLDAGHAALERHLALWQGELTRPIPSATAAASTII